MKGGRHGVDVKCRNSQDEEKQTLVEAGGEAVRERGREVAKAVEAGNLSDDALEQRAELQRSQRRTDMVCAHQVTLTSSQQKKRELGPPKS